jgi:KaiC/GvpD/RAD55 family RecA-like ATPase/tetratricopeptide (TPR) repeat protein
MLVGREHELQELQIYLNRATQGNGTTVLVSGEAGAGKSRLIHEFLNLAKQKTSAVLIGSCLSDSAAPYFPFSSAFRSYFSSLNDKTAQNFLVMPSRNSFFEKGNYQDLFAAPIQRMNQNEGFSPQVWKEQIFANVTQTLDLISNKQPIIIILEDAHWADSASLSLLHYLSRAIINSKPVLIIATYRSDEINADPEGHPHPLAETIRNMRREDLFHEMPLKELNQLQVTRIVESMIRGNIQSQLSEKLTTESKGNPLFIVESIRMLHESQKIVQQEDKWILAASEVGIPTKIKDIILSRLAVLTFGQRRVLDAASVIGEKFEMNLLSDVLALDDLEVLEILNVIAYTTSLVYAEGNSYRFNHARSRETLYGAMSAPLRQGYHRRIAQRLEHVVTKEQLPYSELAYHYAHAGNKENALKYSLAAGQDALSRFSNVEAARHFSYALANMAEEPNFSSERIAVTEGLADALYANCMFKDAAKLYEELSETTGGTVKLRAFRKAMDVAFFSVDNRPHLMELVKKAEVIASSDRLESARVRVQRGRVFATIVRNPKLSLDDFISALTVFEEEYSLPDLALALLGVGATHAGIKDFQAKGLCEEVRAIAIFDDLGYLQGKIDALMWAADGFGFSGLPDQSYKLYQETIKLGEKIGDYRRIAEATLKSSVYYIGIGDFSSAVSTTLKTLDYAKKTDINWLMGRLYSFLITEYSKLGDLKQAEEYLGKITNLPSVGQMLYQFELLIAKASYFIAKSQWVEANECFDLCFKASSMAGFSIVGMDLITKQEYALALEKQGRLEEKERILMEFSQTLQKLQEQYRRATIDASLILPRQVIVGKQFEARLDIVNVSKDIATLGSLNLVFPQSIDCLNLRFQNNSVSDLVELKGKLIGPFEVKTLKLTLKTRKPQDYEIAPSIDYTDSAGEHKTFTVVKKIVTANLETEASKDHITTGQMELDNLLLGGIPTNYAVVLVSRPCNEKDALVKSFIEAGVRLQEPTFDVTTDLSNVGSLIKEKNPNYAVFLCVQRANEAEELPNVFRVRGVENLTELDIQVTKAIRLLDKQYSGPKRVYIEILSDVLLQHHSVLTRKWLSGILHDLKQSGFTILSSINPQMHAQEDRQAILSLFDGEIVLSEQIASEKTIMTLRVRRLSNQKYLDNEITLSNLSATQRF